MSILLPICDGTSKSLVNPMAFAFAPFSTGTDSFATFAFVFAFTFALALAPTEAPQCVYALPLVFAFAYCMPPITCTES